MLHDGHPTARERLERIRDAYAVGTYLGKRGLTLGLVYDRLFVVADSVDADQYVRQHGDPLEWGVFPPGSEIYMTEGWGQSLLVRYPDLSWHWHDSGETTEDGHVRDVDTLGGVSDVLSVIDDLLHEEPVFAYSGGFIDAQLQASLQPRRT